MTFLLKESGGMWDFHFVKKKLKVNGENVSCSDQWEKLGDARFETKLPLVFMIV